jgi:hypothetical protein
MVALVCVWPVNPAARVTTVNTTAARMVFLGVLCSSSPCWHWLLLLHGAVRPAPTSRCMLDLTLPPSVCSCAAMLATPICIPSPLTCNPPPPNPCALLVHPPPARISNAPPSLV